MAKPEQDRKTDDAAALVAVDRTAHDLRRGQPVMIADAGAAVIAIAAELVSDLAITRLRELTGADPDLALTHHRAKVLKVRLYTEDVVLVPLPDWLTGEAARAMVDPTADLANPLRGPFSARRDGVSPATLAAVQLAKISRLLPAVVTATAPEGFDASDHGLLSVAAAHVMAYETGAADALERVTSAHVPLADAGDARIVAFRSPDGGREHLAVVIGDPPTDAPVLVRMHSECFTGDLIGSLKCDCGEQLRSAIERIGAEGNGILLYLRQEGRGIGLINKLRAYALQDQGFDTVEANERLGFESDERVFAPAAEMLRQLGYSRVRLMTNNPDKMTALDGYGIEVTERVPHAFPANDHNAFYLSTKKKKSGHLL